MAVWEFQEANPDDVVLTVPIETTDIMSAGAMHVCVKFSEFVESCVSGEENQCLSWGSRVENFAKWAELLVKYVRRPKLVKGKHVALTPLTPNSTKRAYYALAVGNKPDMIYESQ